MEAQLEMIEANLRAVTKQQDRVESRARSTWLSEVKNTEEKRTFATWAQLNYPEYMMVKQQRDSAQAQYDQAVFRIKGPEGQKILEEGRNARREADQKQQQLDKEKLEDPKKITEEDLTVGQREEEGE